MCIYIYIYVCVCVCVYIHTYIHVYLEREREIITFIVCLFQRLMGGGSLCALTVPMATGITFIYMNTCIYEYTHICLCYMCACVSGCIFI